MTVPLFAAADETVLAAIATAANAYGASYHRDYATKPYWLVTDFGDGTFATPYQGIDFALAVEAERPSNGDAAGAYDIDRQDQNERAGQNRSFCFLLLPGPEPHLTKGIALDDHPYTLMGGGDSPDEVVLRILPARSGVDLIAAKQTSDLVLIGNMTLDGDSKAVDGVHFEASASRTSVSNMVIENMMGTGIHMSSVGRSVVVSNNTIANCAGGIAVDSVSVGGWGSGDEAFPATPGRKFYNASFVENNIVYNYTTHGIQIGQNMSGPVREPGQTDEEFAAAQAQFLAQNPDFADKVAGAWSPFVDWDNEGHPDVDTPNPIVPVRNNLVYRPANSTNDFIGAAWYTELYSDVSTGNRKVEYGEVRGQNPQLDSSAGYRPLSVIGSQQRNDYYASFSTPEEPILGKGSPYRIDYLPEQNKAMRRSMGAFEVRDTLLPLDAYYEALP